MLVGTRFIATTEAQAHEEYKAALSRAKASDTVQSICFQDPGEGEVLTTNAVTGSSKRRYAIGGPGPDDRGRISELPLWAGRGVDAIREIPSAADLVPRMWRECLDAT